MSHSFVVHSEEKRVHMSLLSCKRYEMSISKKKIYMYERTSP